jgi:predicted RNase H-like nuclease (RuvC/YqgF family)
VATVSEATAALEAQTTELESLREQNEELLALVERQVREIEALRAGPLGLLRRVKARLLRRKS